MLILSLRNISPESRKIVKWNAEDAFQWIRKTLNATFDDYLVCISYINVYITDISIL